MPKTIRVAGLPRTNLLALFREDDWLLVDMEHDLLNHAANLEAAANPGDTRTRAIVRQMRRVARFYREYLQQHL